MDRRRVLKLLLACLALPLPLAAQAGQAVKRVWVSRSGSVTKVSLELTGPVAAKHFSLAAPPRLVLDLPQASLQASLNDLALDGTAVTAVRSGITASGDLRIVLDLADSAVRGEVRSLSTGRHGLEWVLTGPPVGVAPVAAKPLARQRDLLIVVDAGHGGKDPGAVGAKGEQEKRVALQIAKLLAKRIDAQKGYKARLVRSDDVFIPLRKRAELAQRLNADLFVSVHADAAPRLTASGASVFALSQGGATSSMARWMAQRENDADRVAGGLPIKLRVRDPMVAGVLLDMSMNSTIATSLDLGHQVLSQLGQVSGLHQARVEQAGFAVLKSAAVPSILVETGFISNAGDCRRLHDARHQRKVAEAIFAGLDSYFRQKPPAGSLIAARRQA
ncbi:MULTISPECIES: N-acetylmuramoyl-L-alanine amidase [unclassified Pseudomonas]|uniref:N-acetylmuramoyl-L-alanine amidase n=1 Tax=unclassified Pseudomonas TaxID=196821 RepID=UPI001AE792D2|nr:MULTISPECIES: N-acetylmuramoyl-L-alanine amidase [unclassified Pseudomonas]MBP2271288.1 N-acetylmuramoyl-L-alanine amidase [Pseudomonas sp. BP6]MBP2289741.1 N-acetylmuramoyl-L-alanine amidase [Pseudomonas sp. BP7]HDS1696485.1 N-acetylmuramoyl-L-alanine amidase [Pseudomonas putida]HDS1701476.1 N-acetylmuramoyl-L-alanine amidase [Pseudomonas putida]